MRAMYAGHRVEALVDVWCDAPVQKSLWRELADSALNAEERANKWGNIEYWFVMGALSFPRSKKDLFAQDSCSGVHP
jgi:TatD DNase family protein